MRACYDQVSTQVGEWGMRVRLPAQQESKLQETPRWSSWAGGQVSRMEHMIKVNLASASRQGGPFFSFTRKHRQLALFGVTGLKI